MLQLIFLANPSLLSAIRIKKPIFSPLKIHFFNFYFFLDFLPLNSAQDFFSLL
jgi:hypothetical protein